MSRLFSALATIVLAATFLMTAPSAASCDAQIQFSIHPEQVYWGSDLPASHRHLEGVIAQLRVAADAIKDLTAEENRLGRRAQWDQRVARQLHKVRVDLAAWRNFQREQRAVLPATLQPVSVYLYGNAAESFELGKGLTHLRNNPGDWGTTQHLWLEASVWKGSRSKPRSYDRPDGCTTSPTHIVPPPTGGGSGGTPRCDCSHGGRPAYEGFGLGATHWSSRPCSSSTPSLACTP